MLPGAAAAAVWGPVEERACEPRGGAYFREYRAPLRGAFDDFAAACRATSNNVMGARFATPDACEDGRGYWYVRDSTCLDTVPALPPRGPDGGIDAPMYGIAELHAHLFAHLAFGETVLTGGVFGDPNTVLAPIEGRARWAHKGITAVFQGFSGGGFFAGLFHSEEGAPSYRGWPRHDAPTHQQMYVDWLFRAYRGGLRLVVVHAVNNQDMFGRDEQRREGLIGGWLLPPALWLLKATPVATRTSNDMEALEIQVRAAHRLAAYVERRWGAPWLEVTETPEEAQRVIEDGRMALVLGSEVDHPFNCDLDRHCDARRVDEGLDKLDALGFAVVFPTHHKHTQFGGAASFHPFSTGPVEDCGYASVPCAQIGLTPLGVHLVEGMMQRGMLVDLGHGGAKPFAETIALLEREAYPAIMSHAMPFPLQKRHHTEYALTWPQLERIRAIDGMVSFHSAAAEYPGAGNEGAAVPFACGKGAGAFVQGYQYARDGLVGAASPGRVAFGMDWNGFASWPASRADCTAPKNRSGERLRLPPPIRYPFALPARLQPAKIGGAPSLDVFPWGPGYDYNETGYAHVGLLPDFLEDMRVHGLSERDLEPLYRSALGFVRTWRAARDKRVANDRGWLRWIPQSPTDLIPFAHLDTERLVGSGPGAVLCRMRKTHQVGVLDNGACRVVQGERTEPPLGLRVGPVRNANSGRCLAVARGRALQETCSEAPGQQWFLCAGGLAPGSCDDDSGVRWLPERVGNTFRLLPAGGGERRCAHVEKRSLKPGARVKLAHCAAPGRADFQWEIDGLRAEIDHELLFATRALEGTVGWRRALSGALRHPVVGADAEPICRPAGVDGALGTVTDGQCVFRDAEGNAGATRSYDWLASATPVP